MYTAPQDEIVYEGTLPSRPDAPAPKKRGLLTDLMTTVKVLLGITVIGGLLIWGAIAIGTAQRDDTPSSSVEYVDQSGISAETLVDALPSSTVVEFCGALDMVTPSAAEAAFAEGYGSGQNPSASEVFAELTTRC
jgi:hypothetical protein